MAESAGGGAGLTGVGAEYLAGFLVAELKAGRALFAVGGGKILATGGGALVRDAERGAIAFPNGAVAVAAVVRPCQGMGNFMQQGAAYLLAVFAQIGRHKMAGEGDSPLPAAAAPQAADGSIPAEAPIPQMQKIQTGLRIGGHVIMAYPSRAGW